MHPLMVSQPWSQVRNQPVECSAKKLGNFVQSWDLCGYYASKINMANVKSVLPLYQKLTEEWNKRSPNLDECGKLLASLKVGSSL